MIKSTVRIEDRDTGLNKIKKEFKGGAVDIGVFGDQAISQFNVFAGFLGIGKISDLVVIAATNEFGTTIAGPNRNIVIPQRSFLRGGVDEKKSDIRSKLDAGKDKIIRGQMTTEKFLKGLGLYVSQKIIVERINRSKEWADELADSTKARKESNQPLVDTGRLKNSITHRVVK